MFLIQHEVSNTLVLHLFLQFLQQLFSKMRTLQLVHLPNHFLSHKPFDNVLGSSNCSLIYGGKGISPRDSKISRKTPSYIKSIIRPRDPVLLPLSLLSDRHQNEFQSQLSLDVPVLISVSQRLPSWFTNNNTSNCPLRSA